MSCLDAQLGAAPVPALGVVANLVVRSEADPVGDRPVLLGLLGQHLLRPVFEARVDNGDHRK